MSRDIRSFFQSKKAPKPKVEDDDDIIPESPDVQIKNKKKVTNKRRVIDDSDEEIFDKKKNKTSSKATTVNKNNSKSPKAPLKEVKAVDIFGSAPIKRTEPLVKKEKKKTETGIHSDDEFDKSLLEIDCFDNLDSAQNKDVKTNGKIETHKVIETECPENKIKETKPPKSNIESTSKHFDSKKEVITKKIDNGPNKDQKRKYAEFIDDDVSVATKESEHKEKKKKIDKVSHNIHEKVESNDEHVNNVSVNDSGKVKKKCNTSLNESVLTDEERYERKRHSAQLYQKYLNRTGPKHLGAKEIPEGSPNCLKDCAFLLTGVLDSFEREEIVDAVNKFGGSIKNTMSKKVTHVLAGDDAGPAKMAKAEELGIKVINEDEFLSLIKGGSKREKDKLEIKNEKKESSNSKKRQETHVEHDKKSKEIKSECSSKNNVSGSSSKEIKTEKSKEKNTEGLPKDKTKEMKLDSSKNSTTVKSKSPISVKSEIKKEFDVKIKKEIQITPKHEIDAKKESVQSDEKPVDKATFSMWVEKYKPQNLKQIIGQHGDASNVKKLSNWLTKWYMNRKAKLPKPSPWAKSDDGGYFKAVLLSGPPGVGKTTTVALVCKELGFDAVEFNASDTRNKTLIKEQIGELLTTTSLSGYAKGDTGKQAVSKKHVLVMDEVDGMAGNEDRGGLQELIGLIKSTSVPIICMCNDRNSQKMRSLVNYCYDLRFSRPRVDQIKSAMLSICFKEGIKIPPDVITQLIVSAGQDVRQTLNLLSMWAIDPTRADAETLRKDANTIRKDVKLGPWDAVRKVFSAEDHKTMSIHDKSDLFFYDYSLSPLFVQENYLQVSPHCPKNEILQRVSMAADSISIGDLVGARIRGSQAWSLLPMQAMYSSVLPGHAMSGHMTGQIQFPGWLGKNSRATKMHRLCQEIHAHTRLSTSGSKSSIFLDYSTHLRDAIINPLIKDKADGVAKSLEILESYHLLREDLESLTEMSVWPGQRNPTVLVDSKVKAAMTRTYNKTASALPYAPGAVKRGPARNDDELPDEDDTPGEVADDSDPENDALIKKKKSKDTEKPSTSKEKKDKPSTSKKSTSSKEKSKKSK